MNIMEQLLQLLLHFKTKLHCFKDFHFKCKQNYSPFKLQIIFKEVTEFENSIQA